MLARREGQPLTRALYRVGQACVRHRFIVIGVWLVVAVGMHLWAASLGQQWNDNLTLPGTGSTQATDLLQQKLPQQAYGSIPVTLLDPNGTLGDAASTSAINATVANLKALPHVTRVVSPLDQGASALLSKDKKIGYISVTLNIGSSDTSTDQAQQILDAAAPAAKAGLSPAVGRLRRPEALAAVDREQRGGRPAGGRRSSSCSRSAPSRRWCFRSSRPILGLLTTLGLITAIGHVTDVPTVAPTLATMIGLGVGIDYALFIVTKHKLHLAHGVEMNESIARATATSGRRGRVRRRDGRDRALLAGRRRHPARVHARLHGRDRGRRVGARGDHPAAGAARRARAAHRLAARPDRAHAPRRPAAARLGADGARGRRPAVAVHDREHGRAARARLPARPPASSASPTRACCRSRRPRGRRTTRSPRASAPARTGRS